MAAQAASNGDSTAWKVILATAFGFTIATLAVILRFVSRWLVRKRLELNDYLIIVAYIFKLGIDIGSIFLVCYGIGRNVIQISVSDLTKYLHVLYIGPLFYAGAIGFTKLSILTLYLSAFPSRYIKLGVYTLSAIVVAWTIAVVVVAIVPCQPIKKAWDPQLAGQCINYSAYYYGAQIPNILTDFAILFLPLKAVFDLRLPTRQAMGMAAVLSLALVTCAFDIVRLVVLVKLPNGGNFTREQVGLSIWTNIEPSIAILVACLPIMRPLLRPRAFMQIRNQPTPAQEMEHQHYDQADYYDKGEYEASSEPVSSHESPPPRNW